MFYTLCIIFTGYYNTIQNTNTYKYAYVIWIQYDGALALKHVGILFIMYAFCHVMCNCWLL
jgi:hypothetical protein